MSAKNMLVLVLMVSDFFSYDYMLEMQQTQISDIMVWLFLVFIIPLLTVYDHTVYKDSDLVFLLSFLAKKKTHSKTIQTNQKTQNPTKASPSVESCFYIVKE